jgi:hypothetical protein
VGGEEPGSEQSEEESEMAIRGCRSCGHFVPGGTDPGWWGQADYCLNKDRIVVDKWELVSCNLWKPKEDHEWEGNLKREGQGW